MSENDSILETQMEEVGGADVSLPQADRPLENLVVRDGVIMLQLVDRLFQRGAVAGAEALPVGILRQKITESLAAQGVKQGD